MNVVSSASIACGAHAGSVEVMAMTIQSALDRGVKIGAHPSYPDRPGFGRAELGMPLDEIVASVRDQIDALSHLCIGAGTTLSYVKPHGALYNRAARDRELADALARCVAGIDARLAMLALAGSALADASQSAGLPVATEAFIDRAYTRDGLLVPRSQDGAVIGDPTQGAARAVSMARDNTIVAIDGTRLSVSPDSLCVHGDSPAALEIVTLSRRQLEAAGIVILPFSS